jgi:hypothetical protein
MEQVGRAGPVLHICLVAGDNPVPEQDHDREYNLAVA